jgi:hypothetical protein
MKTSSKITYRAALVEWSVGFATGHMNMKYPSGEVDKEPAKQLCKGKVG